MVRSHSRGLLYTAPPETERGGVTGRGDDSEASENQNESGEFGAAADNATPAPADD